MQPTLEVGLSGLGLSPLRLRPLLPPAAPSAEEEQRDKALEFGEGGRSRGCWSVVATSDLAAGAA